jgi:hypothetical protein
MPDIQAAQLLSALFPLGGPHLQHLGISVNLEFGQQEMQVLADSLYSSLRSLSLRRGVIKPSFWPALSQHMPHLKELGLMRRVEVSIIGITAYLRALAQPFTLYINADVVAGNTIADLTDNIGAWQLQNILVKREYPAEDADCEDVYEDSESKEEQEPDEQGVEGDAVVDAE